MPEYKAPLRDLQFVRDELLGFPEHYRSLPGCEEATPDVVLSVLAGGARFAEEVLAPLNRVGDREGCKWSPGGSVTTPPGFKEAYRQYVEAGWPRLGWSPEYGGQGLPESLGLAVAEMVNEANWAWGMYPGLSQRREADDRRARHRRAEAHLPDQADRGTVDRHHVPDRGPLRHRPRACCSTKAEPQADGSYRITGTKIFISAGEHDLDREHRPPRARAPAGRAGRAPRASRCSSCRSSSRTRTARSASATTVRVRLDRAQDGHQRHRHLRACNFDGATGWLVGAPNRGMSAMFTFMNAARLGVGHAGARARRELAYQGALAYARERLQMRSLTGAEGARQAGRPDHRAPRRAPHAAHHEGVRRGRRARSLYVARCWSTSRCTSGRPPEREAADDCSRC